MTGSGSRRRFFARRALTSVLAACIAIGLFPSGATAEGGIRKLQKRVPISFPSNSSYTLNLAIDSVHRRAYAALPVAGGTVLRAYDLDSFALVKESRISQSVTIKYMLVDEKTERILVPYEETLPAFQITGFRGVLAIDGKTLTVPKDGVWEAPLAPPPAGMTARPLLSGMTLFSPSTGESKLLFLYQDEAAAGAIVTRGTVNPVFVSQWGATTGAFEWAYRISACRGFLPPGVQQFFRDPVQKAMYVGCISGDGSGLAVRLLLDESGQPAAEETFPGPAYTNRILADPASRRLGFVMQQGFNESIFVFDGTRSAYVGAIGTTGHRGGGIAYGVDTTTGRLLGITADKGIIVGDLRRTPAQQVLTFPQFIGGGDDILLAIASARPGHPRRIFVRLPGETSLTIYEDRVPVSQDPLLSDLDRFTTNTAEKQTVTDVTFDARGHAFGFRTLLIGGVEGLGSAEIRRNFRRIGSPCSFYDRELIAGSVQEVTLSKGDASSAAIATDADPGTKTDVAQPASRCWPVPNPTDNDYVGTVYPSERQLDQDGTADQATGRPWPFARVECAGDKAVESEDDPGVTGPAFTGYRSKAVCGGVAGRAEGYAQARSPDVALGQGSGGEPLVRVGEAVSHVTISTGPRGGVVSRSEAWSRDIEITGVGTIGYVHTIAESRAAGLPGTAKGTFVRELCGVVVPGFEQQGCSGATEAVNALNRALGARGRAYLRNPDPDLIKGSPGGYLASVQKDRFEELSDRALNNDPTTQVTGLELLLINDNLEFGRARQVFQFAGVDAQTTYGIFLLPTFEPPPPIPPLPPIPPVPPVTKFVDIPPTPQPQPKPVVVEFFEKVREGVSLAVRRPGEAVLATLVWLAIGTPIVLARRRRTLGRALRRQP